MAKGIDYIESLGNSKFITLPVPSGVTSTGAMGAYTPKGEKEISALNEINPGEYIGVGPCTSIVLMWHKFKAIYQEKTATVFFQRIEFCFPWTMKKIISDTQI